MSEKITTQRHGHVLHIGFNRPDKYNAFDIDMWHQLGAAYHMLDADPDLRCGLVHAEGKHFSAGLELDQWAPVFASGAWPAVPDGECDPVGLRPEHRVSKPLVFAVHGICYTIGIELMLAGDIRIAAADARFGQIEVARGIYACGGATTRFIQNIGWGNAQRYLLTGDIFNGDEAYRMGMVQDSVDADAVKDTAQAMAEKVAAQAPLGVQGSLASSRLQQETLEQAAVQQFLPKLAPLMDSNDVKEGVQSFLERREARFTGT